MLPCKRCNGEGQHLDWDNKTVTCHNCYGQGHFPIPNLADILPLIVGRKPNTLRSTFPTNRVHTMLDRRAYYVWRLARFHGGVDLTMPVMAALLIGTDPYLEKLDEFADQVAATYFGSNMRAAARWGRALGYF